MPGYNSHRKVHGTAISSEVAVFVSGRSIGAAFFVWGLTQHYRENVPTPQPREGPGSPMTMRLSASPTMTIFWLTRRR